MSSIAQTLQANRSFSTVMTSILAGALIATMWSFQLVDSVIGDTVANSLLGYDAKETPIAGAMMGAMFAFVSGLAGTFTACNICVFSAIAPLAAEKRSVGRMLRPMLWLGAGLVGVAGTYGAIGAMIGTQIPQLSTAVIGPNNFPVRLIQSSLIFSVIGLVFIAWGLMSLGVIRNPFESFSLRYPQARLLLMGALIGGFLIGRPFPLFRKMFEYAAATNNPLYGGLTFVIQGLGNVIVMIAFFLVLTYGTGGRFERWLTSRPGRIATFTAVALLIGGSFFFFYWGVRLPARFGIGWWPTMPWR